MSYLQGLYDSLRIEVEANPSMKKMADRLFMKSESFPSVSSYLNDVHCFCAWMNLAPEKLINGQFDWPALLNDYLSHMISEEGLARATAIRRVFGVKKWLVVNGKLATRDPAWDRVELPKLWGITEDRLPTREELKKILGVSSLEDKILVEVAVSSGLRLGAILGMRIGQIEGLEAGGIASIFVKPEQSKGRIGFITFLTPEAVAVVNAYLRERQLRGEKLTPESPLLAPVRVQKKFRKTGHVGKASAEDRWHKILERSGLGQKGEAGVKKWYQLHFHTLRKYFKTWASMSGVPEASVEFMMGHRTGIAQKYFIPGTKPDPFVLEKMKADYAKALPALELLNEGEKVKELEGKVQKQAEELRALQENKEIFLSSYKLGKDAIKEFEKMQDTIRLLSVKVAELEASKQKTTSRTTSQ